jgi:hypothetical protein
MRLHRNLMNRPISNPYQVEEENEAISGPSTVCP